MAITPISVQVQTKALQVPAHHVCIVSFKGELDESNIDDTAEKLYKVIEETSAKIPFIFDFMGLDYMNSKSLGYLSDWFTKISEKSSVLYIAAPKENIEDTIKTVGLDNFMKLFKTLELAEADLEKEFFK